MYIVKLKLGNQEFQIQDEKTKLTSGSVKQGINSIDSFSFTILPNNVGFNNIRDFKKSIQNGAFLRGFLKIHLQWCYLRNLLPNYSVVFPWDLKITWGRALSRRG